MPAVTDNTAEVYKSGAIQRVQEK